jgi:hypothetical protein
MATRALRLEESRTAGMMAGIKLAMETMPGANESEKQAVMQLMERAAERRRDYSNRMLAASSLLPTSLPLSMAALNQDPTLAQQRQGIEQLRKWTREQEQCDSQLTAGLNQDADICARALTNGQGFSAGFKRGVAKKVARRAAERKLLLELIASLENAVDYLHARSGHWAIVRNRITLSDGDAAGEIHRRLGAVQMAAKRLGESMGG